MSEGISLWDLSSSQELTRLGGQGLPVRGLAFSPDGRRLVSATTDGIMILRDASAGYSEVGRIELPSGLNSVVFSPDSRHLAVTHVNGDVSICDLTRPGTFSILDRLSGVSRSVGFSADGRIVAASTIYSHIIRLWDLPSARERTSLLGPIAGVAAIAFSPTDAVLAASGADGSLSLWDVETGRQHVVTRGLRCVIRTLAFAPGGKTLASGDTDLTIRTWDVAHLVPR